MIVGLSCGAAVVFGIYGIGLVSPVKYMLGYEPGARIAFAEAWGAGMITVLFAGSALLALIVLYAVGKLILTKGQWSGHLND